MNYVLIHSNISTAKTNIKQIVITVLSGNTGSIGNSIIKNHKSSKKLELLNSLICKWDKAVILKILKIFSQNVHKNKLPTNTILENNKDFDCKSPKLSVVNYVHKITHPHQHQADKIMFFVQKRYFQSQRY